MSNRKGDRSPEIALVLKLIRQMYRREKIVFGPDISPLTANSCWFRHQKAATMPKFGTITACLIWQATAVALAARPAFVK